MARGAKPERAGMKHVQRRVHVLHGTLATPPQRMRLGTLVITPGGLGLREPSRLVVQK